MFITWQEFVAGWVGGIAGLVASHPIDTMKVRYQHNPIPIMTTIQKTVIHEGVHGFYKGMLFPALMSGIQNSVFFGAYANSLRYLTRNQAPEAKIAAGPIFFAGCAAGQVQIFVTTPIEVIKVKLQTQMEKRSEIKKGIWQTMTNIHRTEGLRGLYKGFALTMARDVPTGGIYMICYVYLDNWFINKLNISPYWSHLTAGGMAGTISFAPAIPFDFIKTRLQADDAWCPHFKGTWDIVQKSLKEGGYSSLVRGFGLNSIRSFISNAAIFVVYESCLTLLYSK